MLISYIILGTVANLHVSHVHVAAFCQEQFDDLFVEVWKTSCCVEGSRFKGVGRVQPGRAQFIRLTLSSTLRECSLALKVQFKIITS